MRKFVLGLICLFAFALVMHIVYLRPVMTNPAPANPSKRHYTSNAPNVDILSMKELEGFKLRYKNDKFYVYDGTNGYFEVLSHTGSFNDLMDAMDSQPFRCKLYLDTIGRIVVLHERATILIVETYPAFDYDEWVKANEKT